LSLIRIEYVLPTLIVLGSGYSNKELARHLKLITSGTETCQENPRRKSANHYSRVVKECAIIFGLQKPGGEFEFTEKNPIATLVQALKTLTRKHYYHYSCSSLQPAFVFLVKCET
jgi:hypothetical protein